MFNGKMNPNEMEVIRLLLSQITHCEAWYLLANHR